MNSHHHYHHTTAASTNPISAVCYCYSCHPTTYPCSHLPPNPHSTNPYTNNRPPQPHLCASHLTPPPPPLQPPYYPLTQCQCEPVNQNHRYFQEFNHQVNKAPGQQTHRIVTSLLRRIAALESSLRRSSSSPSVSPRSRQTLRDAAALTIQTHFRAFLARRSRTLRQLKQLASIKTTLNVLKSSVSGKSHFDVEAVSDRALDLLVRLHSIQGYDPLIRDGKRSICNELTRFMKVTNGVSTFSSRVVKNVRGGNKSRVFSSDRKMEFDTNLNEAIDKFVASVKESEEEEDHQNPRFSDARKSGVLRTRGGGLDRSHGGLKPKQKKSVTFAENGDAYRVFHSTLEPSSMGNVSEQESFDAEIELMKNLSKKIEKLGMASEECEVDEEEDGGSSESNDNEIDPNYISRKDGYNERNVGDENDNEHEDESFLLSAPLPVKMEARAADYINRKNSVKIVDN